MIAALLTLMACKPDPPPCAEGPGCLLAEELDAGLLSVRVGPGGDIWIVGASPDPSDGSGPVVLHLDGEAWTRLDTSAWDGAELWWAWVDTDEAVFVGTEGLILELDRASGALEAVEGPEADITFFGVWGASADALWAVGQRTEGPPALWQRIDGAWSAWEDSGFGEEGEVWFKVHGAAADDLWIVGTGGQTLHWDGAALEPVATDADTDTSTAPLLTVDAGGERPIVVGGAGNGLILELEDGVWRERAPDFQPGYNGVCTGLSTDEALSEAAWAVGQYGARAQRQADGSWASDLDLGVTAPTLEDWHACAIDDSGGVWTVGGRIASRPLIRGVVGYQGPEEPPAITLEP